MVSGRVWQHQADGKRSEGEKPEAENASPYNNMLPAAYRLKGDSNFKRLIQRGRRFFLPSLMLRIIPTKQDVSRFGFVVSTKISKKAVERNKIRRRLREIIRLELPRILPGYDVLIAARKDVIKLNYKDLRDQVLELLHKARLTNA